MEDEDVNTEMSACQLLKCALMLGRRLLECGAEIYRVEESVERICLSYGARSVDVYAVPTAIVATMQQADGAILTQSSRIKSRGTDLDRVRALNALCRSVCAQPICYKDFQRSLQQIDAQLSYSNRTLCFACGGIAAFFTLLFGGQVPEALLSFVIGFFVQILTAFVNRLNVHTLFSNVLGGIWIGFISLLGAALGIAPHYDVVIIGAIMPLVPGLLITNSIRDMIAGDFMAGISRFFEALISAGAIAAGAAIPFGLESLWIGVL